MKRLAAALLLAAACGNSNPSGGHDMTMNRRDMMPVGDMSQPDMTFIPPTLDLSGISCPIPPGPITAASFYSMIINNPAGSGTNCATSQCHVTGQQQPTYD